jgi:hypothetical protein
MLHLRHKLCLAALTAVLAACQSAPAQDMPPGEVRGGDRVTLGLIGSLPLYHPLGADIAAIAAGRVGVPWQRQALERDYVLEPLDTLAPIPALTAGDPATDPLAGLGRLAVIQPRGLSPVENVALDDWVRGGGRLLMVLDPALTGDYDLPIGDPRRPPDSALIPPVVKRWGMAVSFAEDEPTAVIRARFDAAELPLVLAGRIAVVDPAAAACTLLAQGAAARCTVGKGQVVLIADAALFEHSELAGEDGAVLRAAVREALG